MPGENGGRATEALLLCEKRIEVQTQAFGDRQAGAETKSMRGLPYEIAVIVEILNVGVATVQADVIVDCVAQRNPRLESGAVLGEVKGARVDRDLIVGNPHARDDVDVILHQSQDITCETAGAPRFRIEFIVPDIVPPGAEEEVAQIHRNGSVHAVTGYIVTRIDILIANAELVVVMDHF